MKKMLILWIVMFLFSCSQSNIDKDRKTILYFSRGEPVLLEIWNRVAEEFMKKNPQIRVKIENVDYNAYWPKLLTMIAAGTPPDVVFLESNRMTSYIKKGSLTDLTEYIKKDKSFKYSDFYDIALKPYMRNKKLYGLPNDVATVVMFYNQNIFDEASIPYPKSSWTWDDLLKIAKQLTLDKNNDGKVDQYGLAYYPYDIAIFQNGGDFFNDPANPKKCMLNTKAVQQAVAFCRDLHYKYHVAPTQTEFQDNDGRTMFTMGKIAMIPDGHWMVPRFSKEIKNFNWDVVVLPRKKVRAGSGRGSCFAICQGSQNKEEAYQFIKFITGFEGQKILMESGFSMPALKKIADSKYFRQTLPKNKEAFIEMTRAAHLEPMLENWEEIQSIQSVKLDKVWLNQEAEGPVLDSLTKKINKLLEQ